MKNNPSAMTGLYGSDENFQHAFRYVYRMKDAVDGEALSKAVNTAIKRYPYLAIELVKNEDEVLHTVVPNDRPIVVANRTEPYVIFSGDTNNHMLALLYHDNNIYLDSSHSFLDGIAACEFAKTVLYYYITEKYGKAIPSDNIRTLDTPMTEEEVIDPFLHLQPLTEKPVGSARRPDPSFSVAEGDRITEKKHTLYELKVDEDTFVNYSRSHNGTLATMSAAFLAKAILHLHDNVDRPVRINLIRNLRPVLGTPRAHHSLVGNILLEYSEKVKDWDMEKLGTISRDMLKFQTDSSNSLASIHAKKKQIDGLYAMDNLDAVKSACNQTYTNSGRYVTGVISYVGKIDYGILADYMESISAYVNPSYTNLVVEIGVLNGCLNYSFMQSFSDDVYVKAFAEELRQEGIEVEIGEAQPLLVPRINV